MIFILEECWNSWNAASVPVAIILYFLFALLTWVAMTHFQMLILTYCLKNSRYPVSMWTVVVLPISLLILVNIIFFSVPDICFNYLPVSIIFLCSFLQFYWLLLYLYMLVFFGTVSHPAQADLKLSVGEDDLGLLTLLPIPPKCWDNRCAPPHPGYMVLGFCSGLHASSVNALTNDPLPRSNLDAVCLHGFCFSSLSNSLTSPLKRNF